MATYIATGVVPETGATLTQRIPNCRDRNLALRVAREWARENGLRLWQIEQTRLVWRATGA